MVTRKSVTLIVTCIFIGDYFAADECAGMAEYWIDSGFDDRDDLRGWNVYHVNTVEEEYIDDE